MINIDYIRFVQIYNDCIDLEPVTIPITIELNEYKKITILELLINFFDRNFLAGSWLDFFYGEFCLF